jgi:deoxyhypusine monooxygenase
MWKVPPLEDLVTSLENHKAPIGKRMRAAYFAKQMFKDDDDSDKSERILKVLSTQVLNEAHGSLLRHEFAYVLGQLQTPKACSILEQLLQDPDDCVMVRHEAAEALGAIAAPSSSAVLEQVFEKYTGKLDELADTCMLALNRIKQKQNPEDKDSVVVGCACMLAPYNSVDPTDADPKHEGVSTHDLGNLLLDDSEELVERYRAMFSLRNRGGKHAVIELCRALVEDKSSPLLRHEVAFVLGQLQHPSSINALETSLANPQEHVMVRHESAEALGAIDVASSDEWKRIEGILEHYQNDPVQAVAESCVVALDAADYWGHNNNTNDEDDDVPTFGQQKNGATSTDPVDIRKHMLDQHFNVQTAS